MNSATTLEEIDESLVEKATLTKNIEVNTFSDAFEGLRENNGYKVLFKLEFKYYGYKDDVWVVNPGVAVGDKRKFGVRTETSYWGYMYIVDSDNTRMKVSF